MKKAIKWGLYFICLGALVIYFVGGIFAPEQTKHATDVVISWLNTPVGIAGISTTIGGIIAYIIVNFVMKNTKFGRKELDNIKKDCDEFQANVIVVENNAIKRIEEYEAKYEELKKSCDNKVAIMYDQFEDMQNTLHASLKTIPNKKVQAIVAKYETEFKVRKEEIINKTVNTNEYIDKRINELNKKFDAFLEEIKNEREETVNDKAEAE